ncbi:MAG: MATE family efflux transporter [Blautia sp.]|nr:MATE family efflux transporter [Blautia sp.]
MLKISGPLIAGNILQQMYNMIDALVIERYLGESSFAAAGIAASVMNLFLFLMIGACSGMAILFSQLSGEGNQDKLRNEHFTGLLFGLALSGVLGMAGICFLPLLLHLIQTPAELMSETLIYLRIILAALPVTFIYNFYNALLRSIGDTLSSLVLLLIAVLMNLGLDIYLISEMRLGIGGAASATALSQLLSAVLCILYLKIRYPELMFRKKDCQWNRQMFTKTARFCLGAALHQTGLYIGKMIVQGAVNTGGTAMIAAYTAAGRIEGFANSFGDSGASATSILTGHSYGAGNRKRTQKVFRISLLYMVLLGIVCSVTMYLTRHQTTALLLSAGEGAAFQYAVRYVRLISLFYVFCFTGNSFAGYFEGTGHIMITVAGACSHIAFRALISGIFIGKYGLDVVAVATGIGWMGVNLFWCIKMRSSSTSQTGTAFPFRTK